MDGIAVDQLHAGDGDGADMVLTSNDGRVFVSMFPSNGSSAKHSSRHLGSRDRPLQDHPTDVLSRAVMCQDDKKYEELEDRVLGIILYAGRPLFS